MGSFLTGAILGGLVATPVAAYAVWRFGRSVQAAARASNYEVFRVRADWGHIGLEFRYVVSLLKQGKAYYGEAFVSFRGTIRWVPPLPSQTDEQQSHDS